MRGDVGGPSPSHRTGDGGQVFIGTPSVCGAVSAGDNGCVYTADESDFESWSSYDHGWSGLLDELGVAGEQWECPHEALPDRPTCPFHTEPAALPEEVDQQAALRRAIRTSTDPDSEMTYRHRQFVGATLSEVALADETIEWDDDYPLSFLGASVEGAVALDDTTIGGDFNVAHATVTGGVTAEEATVAGELDARHATIDGSIDARESEIHGDIDWFKTVLDGTVDLRSVAVDGDLDIYTGFVGTLNCRGIVVGGEVDLGTATVDGPAVFRKARIGERLKCTRATIHGDAVFRFAEISGEARCTRATIEGSLGFGHATVDGELTVQEATITDGVSLRAATVRDELNFVDATVAGEFERHNRESIRQTLGVFSQLGGLPAEAAEMVDRVDDRSPEQSVTGRSVEVAGRASFIAAEIDGPVSLANASIGGRLGFDESTVGGLALKDLTVDEGLGLRGATVRGAATLDEATVRGGLDIGSEAESITRFEGPLSVTAATVAGGVDISGDASSDDIVHTVFAEPPTFAGSDLPASTFVHADLREADFSRTDLSETDSRFATLQYASLERSKLSRSECGDADLRGARLGGALLGDVQINEATQLLGAPTARESDGLVATLRRQDCCVYDPEYAGRAETTATADSENAATTEDVAAATIPPVDRDRAKSVYRVLERLASANARPQLQTTCFVRRQRLQRDQYRTQATAATDWPDAVLATGRYLRSTVSEWTLLYGESPWRILAWSGVTVVLFAFLYTLGLMESADGSVLTWQAIGADPTLAIQSLYYSMLTFTALGFGDFRPANLAGQLATVVETSLGAVLLALLVFILGRRAAR